MESAFVFLLYALGVVVWMFAGFLGLMLLTLLLGLIATAVIVILEAR